MADIEMPQLGETVTEGTITKWFKAVGDQVTADEPLFEVSTDKVDSEVPSPAAGYLAEIKVAEGETVDVGTVLAVVSDQAPADGGGGGGTDEPTEEVSTTEPETTEPTAKEQTDEEQTDEEPEQPDHPAPAEVEASTNGGSPPTPTAPAPAPAQAERSEGLLLSPVVRRLIAEHDLDPATIEGTGAGGRITRNDVQRVIEQGDGARRKVDDAPPPSPTRQPPAPAPMAKGGARDSGVPFTNIRRRTGEHMVRSKATSPPVLTVMEVDYEAVERARRVHRDEFREAEGFSLTYLPFIARSLIDALDEFPFMNATVGDGELIVHNYVNLGIAVDLNYEGLIVPVIHEAQDKRLRALAREIFDLADRARRKKLSADDITGGTVTITNAGQYGTVVQAAVINQPQVMILSTEGVQRRPVVITDAAGSEAIAIHSVGNLSMAWDHRAFDGAYAAAFLRRVKEILETRDWDAEL